MKDFLIVLCSLFYFSIPVLGQGTNDYVYDDYGDIAPEELPKFLSTPQNFSVQIGGEITFPCDVDKPDDSFPLMFKHISLRNTRERMIYVDSKALSKNSRFKKERNSFTLNEIRIRDSGKYLCRFESQPVVELSHTLNVQYPASIQIVSEPVQSIAEGSSVTLECMANGNPSPTITWSKKNGHLPSGELSVEGSSMTLTMNDIDKSAEGIYICTATNGIGEPGSGSMVIEIEFKPQVITDQSIVNTANGYEGSLVCIVHARPAAEVKWLRRGTEVSSDRHIMSHDGFNRHTLTITQVSEDDFGEYTCEASNPFGTTIGNHVLTGLPGRPQIMSSPAGAEKESYTLMWTTETFAPIIQYRVKHRRVANNRTRRPGSYWMDGLFSPTNSLTKNTKLTYGGVFEMRHLLSNLEPAEDYETEVRVENKFGWSPFSKRFNFFTRKEIAIGQSSSVNAGAISSFSLAMFFSLLLLVSNSNL